MSLLSEWKTLQYLLSDNSTARLTFSFSNPSPHRLKVISIAVYAFGSVSFRVPLNSISNRSRGCRILFRIATTSIDVHPPNASSTISIGDAPSRRSPSIWTGTAELPFAVNLSPPSQFNLTSFINLFTDPLDVVLTNYH
jgi:hypothetical protein